MNKYFRTKELPSKKIRSSAIRRIVFRSTDPASYIIVKIKYDKKTPDSIGEETVEASF